MTGAMLRQPIVLHKTRCDMRRRLKDIHDSGDVGFQPADFALAKDLSYCEKLNISIGY